MDLFTAIIIAALVVLMAVGVMMELDHRRWMMRLHDLETRLLNGTLTPEEEEELKDILRG